MGGALLGVTNKRGTTLVFIKEPEKKMCITQSDGTGLADGEGVTRHSRENN